MPRPAFRSLLPFSFSLSSALVVVVVLMAAIVLPSLRTAPHHLKRKLGIQGAPASVNAVQGRGKRWFGGSSTSQKALPFTLQSGRASTAGAEEGQGKVLRMLMFGKPGAGKGTLSSRLVKKYDILSFSTGDLLRQHIAER